MNPKDHYDHHLARFYSWMAGDFEEKQAEFTSFLKEQGLRPKQSGLALDLGAGHGIQSVAIAKVGYRVVAMDFNQHLLDELSQNSGDLTIETIRADIRHLSRFSEYRPELIVCGGDTITHLESRSEIASFISDCADLLEKGGQLLLSYRNYSQALTDAQRFIPVKSDDQRIHTCILEYHPETVIVTDLLHERSDDGWEQSVSSYQKVRIGPQDVEEMVSAAGLSVTFHQPLNRMHHLLATRT